MQNYKAKTQKPFTGLCMGVSVDLPYSSAQQYSRYTSRLYTTCATPEGIPSSAASPQIPQIPPPRRTLYRAGQPPIIIRYIRVQRCAPVMDLCQTTQHIADHASPAACNLAPVNSQSAPAGTLYPAGSPVAGARRGGAEPLTATAVSLFGLSPDSQ